MEFLQCDQDAVDDTASMEMEEQSAGERLQMIKKSREEAHTGQKRAAEKMKEYSKKKFALASVGDTIVLNVPRVD